MNNKNRFSWVMDNTRIKTDYQKARSQGQREQLEWIKHQLEYSSFSEKYKLRTELKKGEIYEIDWGLNVNAEFSSRHYGVVLADSGVCNPLVFVCPLKTNHYGAHPRSDLDLGIIEDLKSTKPTLAIVNQIRSIDKLRIFTKRVIGNIGSVCDSDSTENIENENFIPRLEISKVDLIISMYMTMIMTGDEKYEL